MSVMMHEGALIEVLHREKSQQGIVLIGPVISTDGQGEKSREFIMVAGPNAGRHFMAPEREVADATIGVAMVCARCRRVVWNRKEYVLPAVVTHNDGQERKVRAVGNRTCLRCLKEKGDGIYAE